MKRITNEQREAIVRKAIAERDALLYAPDCAGGSPCTNCPDKRQCAKTGCVRQPEFIGNAASRDHVAGDQKPNGNESLTSAQEDGQ